ncbi:MAG: formimidoylglutamate deiminase [Limimaricola sp.]|uniref:formimidoylglutamate deiminase n=1 Tax=Limimaricola sp. TaxID=2211665 RepID=UPI001D2E1BA3|nr:formimidoylglutamate deiminase [Limimaricola sp.]MBI1416426.1 formimidoylglutamate deiminase [Limimaricola sp.]
MAEIRARQALLPQGWASDVTVTIGADGRIAAVTEGAPAPPGAQAVDTLLPAPANLHSHAFQRAMAGLTEARGPDPRDSFWTWRQLMFRFLDRLTPDDVEAIAAFVQMQMLEAGFATNVEFHYLHHRPGGGPYDDPAEMSARIAAAAAATGIGLTLLPVLYRFGGCDGRALGPGQVRFGTTPDSFARLHQGAARALRALPADAVLGAAPHSLRAVAPDDLPRLAALTGGPLHMHLAEQQAEVDEVLAAHGARPVRWLLDTAPPDARWCLIHCTRMTAEETLGLAATGAVAGLCPITEANLGDGIFDGVRWHGADGRWGIGSDSNLRISLAEELRQLDHSQRLRDHSRAALATPGRSTGRMLWDGAARGGAQAAGRPSGAIAPGLWADLVALDRDEADLDGTMGDTTLDAWIFASPGRVADLWAAGRHVVQAGRHRGHDAITDRYRATLRRLREAA